MATIHHLLSKAAYDKNRCMKPQLKAYFSEIGRRGGLKSRRQLDSAQARRMVRIREARRLYRQFHPLCFWSSPQNLRIDSDDVDWVVRKLRENGGRAGWEAAQKLCR